MWYTKFGTSGDIVLSSRIRLARNLDKIPFGAKMNEEGLRLVENKCRKALPDFKFISLDNMSAPEKQSLKECHLISPEMAEKQRGSILINDICTLSILIGEEDHIRIQSMCSGFDLDQCMENANEVDDRLEEKIDFAFSKQLGYLTCCPTNVGTGLRASVMVHLPALTQVGGMESIIRALSKLGIVVRGIYGEGSTALANIYQISNQVTLGISETDSINKLKQVTYDIILKERSTSLDLYKNNKFVLEDRVMRAKGILQNSRIITSNEAMQLLSDVRWGINLGIITNIDHEELLQALYFSLPGSITKNHNTTSTMERDLKRSDILRTALLEK